MPFESRINTVINNTAQNNNTKEKKSISPIGIKKYIEIIYRLIHTRNCHLSLSVSLSLHYFISV